MNSHRKAFHHAIVKHFGDGPLAGAEVGVLQGTTSSYLLSRMPDLTLVCIDPWKEYVSAGAKRKGRQTTQREQDQNFAITKHELSTFGPRATVLRMQSTHAAALMYGATFDFVIIDADHLYESVSKDIAAWYPCIKKHGLLMCHDYGFNEPTWGVRQALDEFAATLGHPVHTGRGYVAWVVV